MSYDCDVASTAEAVKAFYFSPLFETNNISLFEFGRRIKKMAPSKKDKGNRSHLRDKNEPISLLLTDPELLDCYICFEPLSPPIFQCKNGHISCSSCCTKAHNKCPTCSLKIGNMRCRPIEKILESIKVVCRNSKYGCKRKVFWNKMNDHESSCVHEPFSCPCSDCSFVGSSEQLSSHLPEKHKIFPISFSYDSKLTMCFDTDDDFYILQEENDDCLFLLSYSSSLLGNAATISRIGCSLSKEKFYYEIKVEAGEHVHCSQSIAKEIRNRVDVPAVSKGSLLIPNDFFESSSEITLEVCIRPARRARTK